MSFNNVMLNIQHSEGRIQPNNEGTQEIKKKIFDTYKNRDYDDYFNDPVEKKIDKKYEVDDDDEESEEEEEEEIEQGSGTYFNQKTKQFEVKSDKEMYEILKKIKPISNAQMTTLMKKKGN